MILQSALFLLVITLGAWVTVHWDPDQKDDPDDDFLR
jgi:hypothetical protein